MNNFGSHTVAQQLLQLTPSIFVNLVGDDTRLIQLARKRLNR